MIAVAEVVAVITNAAPGSLRLAKVRIVSNATREKRRKKRGLIILAMVRVPAPAATTRALAATTSTKGHWESVM